MGADLAHVLGAVVLTFSPLATTFTLAPLLSFTSHRHPCLGHHSRTLTPAHAIASALAVALLVAP